MRAARLVNLLLTLQRRGRLTAAELAEEFEVSPRTILRDVEALGVAGVPIFTTQGVGGGIELLHGFRTDLTGLNDGEAEALFLVGRPAIAEWLGISPGAASARRKLVESLTPDRRRLADRLDALFLHDPGPSTATGPPRHEVARLFRAAQQSVEADLHFGDGPAQRTRPMGLVLNNGQWWLIGLDAPPCCLDGLTRTRLTQRRFSRPDVFDLAEVWQLHSSRQAS